MNRFLTRQPADAADAWDAFGEWRSGATGQQVPWRADPGSTGCPAKAVWTRVRLFTTDAATPPALIAQALVLRGGDRALLVGTLMLVCGTAIACISAALLGTGRAGWRSRKGLLMIAAISGWQPVLAAVRHLDPALAAAALAICGWYLTRLGRLRLSSAAGAAAACVALPAAGVLAAVLHNSRRSAGAGVAVLTAVIGGTVLLAGAEVVPGYVLTLAYTINTPASAGTTYSLLQLMTSWGGGVLAAVVIAGCALASWWRGTSIDRTFATFTTLGLLAAPVLWSQHLVLALIPAAVLLDRIVRGGSSAALAAWSVLVLSLSLPDPAVSALSAWVGDAADGLTFAPGAIALPGMWLWAAFGASDNSIGAAAPVRPPGEPLHVSWRSG